MTVQNDSIIGVAGSNNTATDNGGGIYNDFGSTTTVYTSTILTNTATFGGGIYNTYGGLSTVDGSFISDNQALNGGGICN